MLVKNDSVILTNPHPAMLKVFKIVDSIYQKYGHECVITSGFEVVNKSGRFIHSPGSLHYIGRAIDIRTRFFDDETLEKVAKEIKFQLAEGYDVVVEPSHIHIEYDPK